jgi:hypothetical protein
VKVVEVCAGCCPVCGARLRVRAVAKRGAEGKLRTWCETCNRAVESLRGAEIFEEE